MQRLVTNITLPAVLATVLLLPSGKPPAARQDAAAPVSVPTGGSSVAGARIAGEDAGNAAAPAAAPVPAGPPTDGSRVVPLADRKSVV